MTRRVRVPIANTPQKTVTIDPAATEGAVIGRNVWNADGTLYVPAQPAESSGEIAKTIWRYVLEVPANVQAVAALASDGFVRRSGSTWTAAPIANADLAGADTTGLAEGANLYHTDERAAAAAPIQSIVAGTNVTVDVTDPANPVISAFGGGGSGAVDSVNGQTGAVVLDAADVGAATAAQGAKADTALQTAVLSLTAGTNVSIDATDPEHPVISSTGGGSGNVPAGGTTGQVLVKASATDYDTEWVDQSGSGGEAYDAPPTTGWTWVNQGTATLTSTASYQQIDGGVAAGYNTRGRYMSLPAGAYRLTACLQMNNRGRNVIGSVISLRDSVSGALVNASFVFVSGYVFEYQRANSATAWAGNYMQEGFVGSKVWVQIEDDGTSRILRVGPTRDHLIDYSTLPRTDHITPDQVGFASACEGTHGISPSTRLVSWLLEDLP